MSLRGRVITWVRLLMTDNVLGIDVNRYRKNVPLVQAKIQGVRFLIGKCSERLAWVDPTYGYYKKAAKSRNLPFGGYMYWRVLYDAALQAKHFVNTLGETEFPPIIDVERYLNTFYGTNVPLKPINFNRAHLRIVLNEVERLTDRKPMIYTNFASWRTIMADDPIINEYPVWVANYGRTTPYLPMPLKEWTLWQWTSTYKIEGYYRGVDANYFNGNEAAFETWLESMKPPEPPEEFGFFFNFKGEDWEGLVKRTKE